MKLKILEQLAKVIQLIGDRTRDQFSISILCLNTFFFYKAIHSSQNVL